MLNAGATEAIFSATYVDNYIDSVENLPDDVQRQLSRIRDIDVQYRGHLRDVDHYYDLWKSLQNVSDVSTNRKARACTRMQQSLIHALELGDEKMQIVNQLQELIDHKTRQLDFDQKNLDIKEDTQQQQQQSQDEVQFAATPPKVARTQSPTRDVVALAVDSQTAAKEQQSYASNASQTGTNGVSGTGAVSVATAAGNSATLNVAAESLRSVSKRSRRRNESNHTEQSVANETHASNEAVAIADRSASISGNSGTTQKQVATVAAVATQKKQPQSVAGIVTSAAAVAAGNTIAVVAAAKDTLVAVAATAAVGGGTNNSNKKKKRKTRGAAQVANAREETPPPDPIDPDEPTYCLCDQISFGEMILCDNDLCPIEWFHFSCVALVLKPKGKWYCPNCRGDRPNVMKPKAQFLKELERYNKEKEEKT